MSAFILTSLAVRRFIECTIFANMVWIKSAHLLYI